MQPSKGLHNQVVKIVLPYIPGPPESQLGMDLCPRHYYGGQSAHQGGQLFSPTQSWPQDTGGRQMR